MGIRDAVSNIFGGGEEEQDTTLEDAGFDEPEEEQEEEEFEFEPEPEPEEEQEPTWDNAYDFTNEALQQRGFGGVKDACAKAMARRVKSSPKFRDPIKTGAETANLIASSAEQIEGISAGDGDPIERAADQLSSANQLAEEVDRFTNSEDQFLWEIQSLAREGLEVIKQSDIGGGSGEVSTSTSVSSEEI